MRPRRSGLTLVEVAVTIALVAILSVPTGFMVSELLRIVMIARDSNEAMNLARYELERLDAIHDFLAPDLGVGTTELPNYRGMRFTLSRTVICDQWEVDALDCTVANANTARKRIEVTVADPTPGTQSSMTLTTYRTKGVQYGL